uniref:Uncharacterized protein n=1 Tax=Alexandrium catenella TaxID=2925 RepID=A0A7S1SEB1_ALECA|mmetsp:Transcript_97699/g.259573  ORF Transcript_97699/g.259573 Transcript_97699/m.259573 type:complete len:508 (+) Transcript_97699:53-1576(+)
MWVSPCGEKLCAAPSALPSRPLAPRSGAAQATGRGPILQWPEVRPPTGPPLYLPAKQELLALAPPAVVTTPQQQHQQQQQQQQQQPMHLVPCRPLHRPVAAPAPEKPVQWTAAQVAPAPLQQHHESKPAVQAARPPNLREAVVPLPSDAETKQPELGQRTRSLDFAIRCPGGHAMKARVSRELWTRSYEAECCGCHQHISAKDASYNCKECVYDLCMDCSTELQASMPGPTLDADQDDLFCLGPCNEIAEGDIFFCGPDKWGIHHVVLASSTMTPAERTISEKILQHHPDLANDVILCCNTIECTRPFRGQDYPWYPAMSVYTHRPSTGELFLIGDIAEGTAILGISDELVPVKLLLHPLRPGRTSTLFNSNLFQAAMEHCARESRRWSKGTAIKAITAKRSCLRAHEYAEPEARLELMEDLRRSWCKKPICSSVAIKVWQKYFEMSTGQQGTDLAVQRILRWMPVFGDRTAPSMLLETLSTHGWMLRSHFCTDSPVHSSAVGRAGL